MSPLVWWLSQAECEAIGDALPASFPEYLRDAYQGRRGRPGSGRLWADTFGPVSLVWANCLPIGRWADRCGCIAIHAVDVMHLAQMPGIVTDLQMRRWPAVGGRG